MYIDNNYKFVTFNFYKVSEENEPSVEDLSQSGSDQRTADEKSNGNVSDFQNSVKKSSSSMLHSTFLVVFEEIEPFLKGL